MVLMVHLVHKVLLVCKAPQDLLDHLVKLVFKVYKAQMDPRDRKDRVACWAPQDQLVYRACLELRVLREILVILVKRDRRDPPALLEMLDLPDLQAHLGYQAHLEVKDLRA